MRLRGRLAIAAIGAIATVGAVGAGTGCTSEAHLPLPAVDGAVVWVVVASSSDGTQAEVIGPDGPLHLDVDGRTLEALAFAAPLGVPLGPLAPLRDGDPLPAPAATFTADLDALRWSASSPSPAFAALRIPRPAHDCPRFSARTYRLLDDEPGGVFAFLPVDDVTRLALTPSQWFLVTADEVLPVAPPLTGAHAIAREPDGGRFFLARGGELWTIDGPDILTGTATLAHALPQGLAPFTLAAPARGVVYGLGTDGRLFRSDTATTTIVHRFRADLAGTRGMVLADGDGIVAGLGPDQGLVTIDAAGIKRVAELPSSSDGVVSIARLGELGLVIGTNNGNLLAESLGFRAVPDPLAQIPRGGPLRALRVVGDRLLYGGNSGVFGEISARRFVCTSPFPASSTVRVLEPLGDQILAAGLPIQANSGELQLTRYTVEP